MNIKFLAQKKQSICGRISLGQDKNRPADLRVEWDPEAWTELRPDGLKEEFWNKSNDPLAYPAPGENPDWEQAIKKDLQPIFI